MRDPDVPTETKPQINIGRLKRRADFLRVGKGKRYHTGPMTLQGASAPTAASEVRIGFTLTRKVGNAVVRNRARRRLKEAVRLTQDLPIIAGHDYVIVGRIDAVRLPFAVLQRELARAVRGVHSRESHATRPQRIRPAP